MHKLKRATLDLYLCASSAGKRFQSDYKIACDFDVRGSSKVMHKPQAASFQSYYTFVYDCKFREFIAFMFKPEQTSLKHYQAIVVVF